MLRFWKHCLTATVLTASLLGAPVPAFAQVYYSDPYGYDPATTYVAPDYSYDPYPDAVAPSYASPIAAGAATGAAIGLGAALLSPWHFHHFGRDMAIGAGIGAGLGLLEDLLRW